MLTIPIPSLGPIEIVSYYSDMSEYYLRCEPETKKWFVDNIKEDWVIIDAGAHLGYFTILFSRMANKGHVYAFEPTDTYGMLIQNLIHNNISNVTAIKNALGNKNSKYVDSIYRRWGKQPECLEYTFSTIDAFAAHISRIDLIKIDVDSFDFEVMQGALTVLSRCNPYVVVEVNDTALGKRGYTDRQFLKWIRGLGYSIDNWLDKENLLLSPR